LESGRKKLKNKRKAKHSEDARREKTTVGRALKEKWGPSGKEYQGKKGYKALSIEPTRKRGIEKHFF